MRTANHRPPDKLLLGRWNDQNNGLELGCALYSEAHSSKGKKYCVPSKALEEKLLEGAFVESYRLLCSNNADVLEELMRKTEAVLSEHDHQKALNKIMMDIQVNEQKRCKLIDMCLEEKIDRLTYERKYEELDSLLAELHTERTRLENSAQEEAELERRIEHFRKVLQQGEIFHSFDRNVFESIVDKVIIGDYSNPEKPEPYKLTFVYKTGFQNAVQSKMFKQIGKKFPRNEGGNLPSYLESNTCGSRNPIAEAETLM